MLNPNETVQKMKALEDDLYKVRGELSSARTEPDALKWWLSSGQHLVETWYFHESPLGRISLSWEQVFARIVEAYRKETGK